MLAPHVAAAQSPAPGFRHEDHRAVDCLSCHTMDTAHGELRVRSVADCRACHHAQPLASDCAACHTSQPAPGDPFAVVRALGLTVGRTAERTLPFSHSEHASVDCASCHTGGAALSAREVSCANCHVEHHAPQARCVTCHIAAPEPPHTVDAHVGCAGAGCHEAVPWDPVPRTREVCVACHQDMEAHRPGPACATCHLLPPMRGAGG